LVDAFYRTGSPVFGGGHVVLPLLQASVVPPGWVTNDVFLAGYGAVQAVPGPLFTFSAYLGTVMGPQPNGLVGAVLCLAEMLLPAFLLVIGPLPFWDELRTYPWAQSAWRGINAAVVGLLLAALYSPVWSAGIAGPGDFALGVAAFLLLFMWQTPPWLVRPCSLSRPSRASTRPFSPYFLNLAFLLFSRTTEDAPWTLHGADAARCAVVPMVWIKYQPDHMESKTITLGEKIRELL
jgi:chromate transport protein ChrA